MEKLTLNINLSNFAITQYCNYNFNSFAQIGNNYIGASETGLFILGDEKDAGADIDAFFELVTSDFGAANAKRIRSIHAGFQAKDNLLVTLKDHENNSRDYVLSYTHYDRQGSGKVAVSRDGISRYWSLKVANTNGAYFAVDSIELIMVILGKKPRRIP
ncbi:MAG: hypothetical protein BA863_04085 [Desulfovibrio sp. S3730MH75]|nr:MAG: hypothetical protein BA863_04085 [Desulfovibrio sp. S3730MH75]